MPGMPHHVMQGGNLRQQTFFRDDDSAATEEQINAFRQPNEPADRWATTISRNASKRNWAAFSDDGNQGPRDPNEWVYIPFTVAKKICRGPDETENETTMIGIKPYHGIDTDILLRKIKSILRFWFKTKPGEDDEFTVFDQTSMILAYC